MSEKTVIDINGVKLEVDLRQATTVESYKIGDKVKVLKKQWGDTWTSYAGVIVGFDNFKNAPTIIILFIASTNLEFVSFNKESKDIEICPASIDMQIEKEDVVNKLNRDIQQKEAAVSEAKEKRDLFLRQFGLRFDVPKN